MLPNSQEAANHLFTGLLRPSATTSYENAATVLRTALSHGANLWNGAEFYGPPHANSLQLLADYFTRHPEDAAKVVLTMKGCFSTATASADCSAAGVERSLNNCLSILGGRVFIDVFAPARIDEKVPIEDTMRALAKYVEAGKIGGIGLSECNATTIRRAHSIHPLASVEVELSLFSTDILHNGVAATCAELGIPIIAYSPLSRGWLTGQLRHYEDLPEGDSRRMFPRFQPEVFDQNLKLVEEVEKLSKAKGVTMPQTAIAWVRAQSGRKDGPIIVPIPGATKVERVQENLDASVRLDEKELQEIQEALEKVEIKGERYGGAFAKFMNL